MDSQDHTTARKVIPPRGGLMHALDAAQYSFAGFRRLFQETATKLELGGALIVMIVLIARGATVAHWIGAAVLLALLLAVEALNTAIEELADHVSPEWSLAAKHAKDLGSLAVGLLLTANGVYLGVVLFALI